MIENNECNNKLKSRIYELDLLKGIGIIGVLLDHFIFYIYLFSWLNLSYLDFPGNSNIGNYIYKFSNWFLFGGKFSIIFNIFRGMFILFVGISFSLSRDNLKRGIKLFLTAISVSLSTFIIYFITKNTLSFISFGILHALSVSILLSYPLYRYIENKYFFLVSSVIVTSIGYYFFDSDNWVFYGTVPLYKIIFGEFIGYLRGAGTDSFPGLLVFGLVLFGIFLGKHFYKDKKSLFGLEYKDNFLSKAGRYSLFYYLVSRFVVPFIVFIILFLFTLIKRG